MPTLSSFLASASTSFRSAAIKGLGVGGVVKNAKSGRLRSLHVVNLDNAVCWVQLFDVADNTQVTLGTTPPTYSIHLAALAEKDIVHLDWGFANGIVIATTTTDGGSSSPATGASVTISFN